MTFLSPIIGLFRNVRFIGVEPLIRIYNKTTHLAKKVRHFYLSSVPPSNVPLIDRYLSKPTVRFEISYLVRKKLKKALAFRDLRGSFIEPCDKLVHLQMNYPSLEGIFDQAIEGALFKHEGDPNRPALLRNPTDYLRFALQGAKGRERVASAFVNAFCDWAASEEDLGLFNNLLRESGVKDDTRYRYMKKLETSRAKAILGSSQDPPGKFGAGDLYSELRTKLFGKR